MTWLVYRIAAWVVHAAVVMISVGAVSPGNPSNKLGRALLVTFLVALIVTPFAYFWPLILPAIIALILWSAIYAMAYGIGFLQSIAAGLVQVALGVAVDYF